MTLLVLVRRDSERVATALRLLQPSGAMLVVGLHDPLPPHELRLAGRGLLGRGDRGRPHEREVDAAGREAAREAAEELAAAARELGFEVQGIEVTHPGPKEIDGLLARVRPELVIVERGDRPPPPPLRHLADRGPVGVLFV
jgi:uncharacterized protein (DUF58 family)